MIEKALRIGLANLLLVAAKVLVAPWVEPEPESDPRRGLPLRIVRIERLECSVCEGDHRDGSCLPTGAGA